MRRDETPIPVLEETAGPLPDNSAGWLTKLVLSKSAENDKIGEPFAELGWSHFISLKAGKVIELMAALEISDSMLPVLIFSPGRFRSIVREFTVIPRNLIS